MIKNPIGHKIHELLKNGYGYKLNRECAYEIKRILGIDEVENDYCRHFIVAGNDGTEKEIREVECVFVPDTEKDEVEMISSYLSDNGVYAEVFNLLAAIVVSIEWGDWKHDHGWCRNLMSYIGYDEVRENVTEENGSDCYSAEHYFLKQE